jgi:pyridoxal phosphate enzyme (YggS family)
MNIKDNLNHILSQIPEHVALVAVSKTKPIEEILEAYKAGQRIFGENKIQEMADKYEALPKDIEWHMIGHVQTNKVKYMASFVSLVHGVDSFKLLNEINKQAKKNNRVINCLLQIKIAEEDSKFGLSFEDAKALLESPELKTLTHIKITGLMGMATFTDNEGQLKAEFNKLQSAFNKFKEIEIPNCEMTILSMGMSGDYKIAIDCGSNMIRVGSSIFGERNY